MKRFLFSILIIVLYPFTLPARDNIEIKEIRGLAVVKIKSRHVNSEWEQAIVIKGNRATLVGLDDFGGETFRIYFTKRGMTLSAMGHIVKAKPNKLKKILSLPITQDEFLNIMKYQRPEGFLVINENNETVWQKKNKKKLRVRFGDFKKNKLGKDYPQKILITYKKNYLDVEWIKVIVK